MKIKIMFTTLLVVVFLYGCSTSDKTEKTEGTQEGSVVVENPFEEVPTLEEQDRKERSEQKTLKYNIEGELYESIGMLQKSKNQHFSMYMMPEYQLYAEEQGKDIMIYKGNDSSLQEVAMRIEILPEDPSLYREISPNPAFEKLKRMAKARAQSVSEDYFLNDSFLETDFLKRAIWYKSYTEEEAVSTIVVTSTSNPIVLTIYTPREIEVLQPILAMAETIEVENRDVKNAPSTVDPNTPTSNNESERPTSKEISYKLEGLDQQKIGTLYESETQNLSFYIFEPYAVKTNRAGNDIIFSTLDESFSVEVERYSPNTDWEATIELKKNDLKKVNSSIHETVLETEEFPILNGSQTFYALNDSKFVQVIINKKRNVLFTYKAPKESDGKINFLAMINTIEVE